MKQQTAAASPSWDFLKALDPHYGSLIRYCEKLTGNHSDAEDLMQDFLLSLSLRGFAADGENLRPQLFTALRNRHIDNLRRQRSAARHVDLVSLDEHAVLGAVHSGPVHEQPEQRLQASEDLDQAIALIDELPESQREAVRAVVLEQDDIREVAKRTHRSVHTVKSTLSRARARLVTCARDRQRTPGLLPAAATLPTNRSRRVRSVARRAVR